MTREQFAIELERLFTELASNTMSERDIIKLTNSLTTHISLEQPSVALTRRTLAYLANRILDAHKGYPNKLTNAALICVLDSLLEVELCN